MYEQSIMSENITQTLNKYKLLTSDELETELHRLEEYSLQLLQLYKTCQHNDDRIILQERIHTVEFYIKSLQSILYMKHT